MSFMSDLEAKEKEFSLPQKIRYQDENISLILRPLEEEDAEIICDAILLSIESLLPFMDWVHREQSVEGQLQRIQRSKECYAKGTEFDFSVFEMNSRDYVMSATLGPSRTPNKKSLSIGYWTSSKYSNKGFATLVTKVLTVVAFEHMSCDRVEIGCNEANEKSIRVIEKCGFFLEGKARNYFTEPTSAMLQNGYYPNRTCLQYALVTQDLKSLPWFNEVKKHLVIQC